MVGRNKSQINRFSVIFFFFKQKTAYEIVDCDWSSDVCSSDLVLVAVANAESRSTGLKHKRHTLLEKKILRSQTLNPGQRD